MEANLNFIGQLSIKDLLDIFVVSVLIYKGLLIVHGTRAVQMLYGVGGLIVLFWLGHIFELYGLNWVLDHFFDSFFIIAIILFQEQFRNALASFGTGQNIFTVIKKEKETEDINEVVEAVSALAADKIGAIIVIERNHGLVNYLATGTRLGGLIHSDILYAIFQSSGPLHDGSVIIRRGRLAGAGCFLPLSKNIEIDRHLGTRHRAALGVTEGTDAVAITVSEETGNINIAVNGNFYLCEKPKQLRQYLKHLITHEHLDGGLLPIKPKAEV